MIGYAVLITACAAMGWLTWRLWRKTGNWCFPVGALFVYFWTLHGAWEILGDRNLGRYNYLFEALLNVEAGNTYTHTLVLYAVFVIALLGAACWYGRSSTHRQDDGLRLVISNRWLLLICGCCAAASMLMMAKAFHLAWQSEESVYQITRTHGFMGPWFAIHTILNRAAIVPAALGLATVLSGPDAKFTVARGGKLRIAAYLCLILAMLTFCALLGNKNEVFFAAVAGGLFYLANSPRPRIFACACCEGAVALLLVAVNWSRHLAISELAQTAAPSHLKTIMTSKVTGECYAGHMSLYGVLKHDVPLTWGSSLLSLASSVVPRMFWADRPENIYSYYVRSIDATSSQGFTIHHAAGWYLNFGTLGVLLGGVAMGLLWAWSYNQWQASRTERLALWQRVFVTFAVFTFTGNLPNVLRAGIEGYKGFLLHAWITPMLILLVCARVRPAETMHLESAEPALVRLPRSLRRAS